MRTNENKSDTRRNSTTIIARQRLIKSKYEHVLILEVRKPTTVTMQEGLSIFATN